MLDIKKLWFHAACRSVRSMVAVSAALTTLVVLSGCEAEKKTVAQPKDLLASHVREATEQSIRSGFAASTPIQFRGVQVYAQAMPQRIAVCGQVNPFANNPNLFVPFVALVTSRKGPSDGVPQYTVEPHIATNTSEASQVYVALVTYCYDQGGPIPARRQSVVSIPPLPDTISKSLPIIGPAGQPPATPTQLSPPPVYGQVSKRPIVPAIVPNPASNQASALGRVTMQQDGNLHSTPAGPVVVAVPRGTVIQVFSQTRDGWYQVGGSAPWGWVYKSVLEGH